MKNKKVIIPLITIFIIINIIFIVLLIPKSTKENNKNDSNKIISVEEQPKKKTMSLIMLGDTVIHGAVFKDAYIGNGNYDFSSMFDLIKEEIKDYDLKYYNQETIIGGKNLGIQHYPRFNSPDEIGLNLVSTGFNMVSLATNHTLDQGEQGILYSNSFWRKQDVITAGSYSSFEERNVIPVHEQNGIKYAFLSYTQMTNGLPVPSGKEYLVNVYSDEKVKEDIEKIKDKVDVIIVAMHWGEEYVFNPVYSQKRIAEYLSSLGVNLIIGSHPHVVQPVTYVGDTLVIYSLGNFISAQHELGLDKIIGLMIGLDINVEDGKVTFDNIDKQLIYTYCNSYYKNFKVYPFSKLNDSILPNYKSIEEQYLNIVNSTVE